MNPIKKRNIILRGYLLLGIHFTVIALYLVSDMFSWSAVFEHTSRYSIPVFEQSWGMFSSPPAADLHLLVQFKVVNNGHTKYTAWQNITAPQINRGALFFSYDQRISKFFDGCENNLLKVLHYSKAQGKSKSQRQKILNQYLYSSSGYLSVKEYSRIVFQQMQVPLNNGDNIYFRLKLVNDRFPAFEHRDQDFFDSRNHKLSFFTSNYTNIN